MSKSNCLTLSLIHIYAKNLYQTQYVIWSNFDMDKKDANLTTYQLAAEVFDRIGTVSYTHLSMIPYRLFINRQRKAKIIISSTTKKQRV